MASSGSRSQVDPQQVWIYHERQQALLCGQHALNNLAQANLFSAGRLAEIAHQLDQRELQVFAQNNEGGVNSKDYLDRLAEGSHHVDAQGNFSIEVLKVALQEQLGVTFNHLAQQDLLSGKDITDVQGFLCHKSDHWFAIRLIGGRFWNLNSMLERPTVVSHFQLATEMEKWQGQGYTVFCVPTGLPLGGAKLGRAGSNWHRMSDLLQGKSTDSDPWENLTGSGMRLDGRQGRASSSTAAGTAAAAASTATSAVAVEGLTEEEQLQLALQASMEPAATKPPSRVVTSEHVTVPSEPAAGAAGSVRIQFKFSNGKRVVRRFMGTGPVSVVYAFCQQQAPNGGGGGGQQAVELKCGYPPKNLEGMYDQTIEQARLANESIQARYL